MALTPQEQAEYDALQKQYGNLSADEIKEYEALMAQYGADALQPPKEFGVGDVPKQLAKGAYSGVIGLGELPELGARGMAYALRGFEPQNVETPQQTQARMKAGAPEPGLQKVGFYDMMADMWQNVLSKPIQESREKGLGKRVVPKGESKLADFTYTAGEFGFPTTMLSPKKLKNIASDFLRKGRVKGERLDAALDFVKQLRPTRTDTAMGALAGTGEFLGNMLDEKYGETGKLIGGFTPLLYKAATGSPEALRKLSETLSKTDFENVIKFIEFRTKQKAPEIAGDVKKAVAEGEKGTTADVIRSPQMAEVEALIDPTVKARKGGEYLKRQQAAEKQLQEQVKGVFGEGDPTAAREIAREKTLDVAKSAFKRTQAAKAKALEAEAATVKDVEAAKGKDVQSFKEQADALIKSEEAALVKEGEKAERTLARQTMKGEEALGKLNPYLDELADVPPSEMSRAFVKADNEHQALLSAELEKGPWREMRKDRTQDATGLGTKIKNNLLRHRDNPVNPLLIEKLEKSEAFQDLAKQGANTSVDTLDTIVGQLKDSAAGAFKNDQGKLGHVYNRAAQQLEKYTKRVSPALKQAKAGTIEKYRIGAGDLIQGLKDKKTASEVLEFIFVPGPLGREHAEMLAEAVSKKTKMPLRDYQKAEQLDEFILAKAARSDNLPQFLKEYEEFFTAWDKAGRGAVKRNIEKMIKKQDEMAQQVKAFEAKQKDITKRRKALPGERETMLKQATDTAVQQTKEAKQAAEKVREVEVGKAESRLTRARSRLEKTQINQFFKNPTKTVKEALSADTDEPFKALAGTFKTPAEKTALKTAIGDVISEQMKKTGLVEKGDVKVSKIFENLKARVRPILTDAEYEELVKTRARQEFRALKNSFIGQKLPKDKAITKAADAIMTFGAMLITRVTPGSSLIMAGFARRNLRRLLLGLSPEDADKAVGNLMQRMITEPETFVEVVETMNKRGLTKTKAERELRRFLKNAIKDPKTAVAAGQANQEEE